MKENKFFNFIKTRYTDEGLESECLIGGNGLVYDYFLKLNTSRGVLRLGASFSFDVINKIITIPKDKGIHALKFKNKTEYYIFRSLLHDTFNIKSNLKNLEEFSKTQYVDEKYLINEFMELQKDKNGFHYEYINIIRCLYTHYREIPFEYRRSKMRDLYEKNISLKQVSYFCKHIREKDLWKKQKGKDRYNTYHSTYCFDVFEVTKKDCVFYIVQENRENSYLRQSVFETKFFNNYNKSEWGERLVLDYINPDVEYRLLNENFNKIINYKK